MVLPSLRLVTARRRDGAGDDEGVTLIEVIISLALLVTVMLTTAGFFTSSLKESNGQVQAQEAATLANQQLEYTRSVAAGSLLTGRTQSAVQAAIASKGITNLSDDITNPSAAPLNYDPAATAAGSLAVPITMHPTVDNTAYTVTTFINPCYVQYPSSSGTSGCTTTNAGKGWMYRITVNVAYKLAGGRACPTSSTSCQFVVSTLRDAGSDPCFNVRTDLVGCTTAQPAITTISPSTFTTNSSNQLVTITGKNFASGATVTIDKGGSVSNVVVVNATTITFKLSTANTPAAIGTSAITVTNPDGTLAEGTILINASTLSVTGVSPSAMTTGQTKTITISGSGFQTGGTTVSIPSQFGTINGTPTVTGTSISFSFTSASTAAAVGSPTVTVTNPDGTTATGSLSIDQTNIAVTSVAPSSLIYAATRSFTISGSGFLSGATVSTDSSGGTVTVGAVTSTSIGVTLSADPSIGTHTFTVTNPDGGTASGSFSVANNAMVVNGVSPDSSTYKSTKSYTISGSNFSSSVSVKLDVSGTEVGCPRAGHRRRRSPSR